MPNNLNNVTPVRGGVIHWISTLRGFLVLLVFISHLSIPILSKDVLFVIGRIGVVGFFLMAGYLAVGSLSRRNTIQFYWNRFLRIYPIYWILLLMTYILSDKISVKEMLMNATLFEEFVGYEAMIGSAWMLPIMVVFFACLPIVRSKARRANHCLWLIATGCMALSVLRYLTGKPFPTALGLLLYVGLLGYLYKVGGWKKTTKQLIAYEGLLVVCAWLSYGDGAVKYFIAYNLGFIAFFMFEKFNVTVSFFKTLGEQGFTFFLGASIPVCVVASFYPAIKEYSWYWFDVIEFFLAFIFSYILTNYCESPLLRWGKRMENLICKLRNTNDTKV